LISKDRLNQLASTKTI